MSQLKENLKQISFLVSLFVFMTWFLIILPNRFVYQKELVIDDTVNELKVEFSVLKGIIESPAVIIIIEDYNEFIEKVYELKSNVIYYDHDSFYVFKEDYTIAWKYQLVCETYGFPFYPKLRRAN